MSKRIEIYKEMKTLVDLEKKLAENSDDTYLKNIIGVKPKEVDLKLLHNGLYKCMQYAYAKKPKGAVETHMYNTWNRADLLYVLFIYNPKLSVTVPAL